VSGFDPVTGVLLVPLVAGAILALLPGYKLSAGVNLLASLSSLVCALLLLVTRPERGQYLLVDDLNVVFIVLNSFVGFTTSAFSASYIGHELEIGRLTPRHLRFYHAMFQIMMFGMNLALVANNIGLMWVAVELATLTTVVMVGIYRTPQALEAAWKYFILGSVGIALALFGTILVYLAARPTIGEGLDAMVWTTLLTHAKGFDPNLLNLAFVFLLLGYGTKVGLAPMHDFRRVVGAAVECGAVRTAAVQNAAGGQPGLDRAGTADGGAGTAVADLRRIHVVSPARHQAAVRLLVH
jgi:hydrogenase-4 component F